MSDSLLLLAALLGLCHDRKTPFTMRFEISQGVRSVWVWCRKSRAAMWLGLAWVVVALLLVSCAPGGRTLVMPPQIPGAKFAGTESCAQCHAQYTQDFHGATHSAVATSWSGVGNVGCELCHGPASLHIETGGALNTIINPKRSPEVCFDCHQDVRSRFNLPHHHLVTGDAFVNGAMSCGECHSVHKGPAVNAGAASLAGINAGCISCHPAQRGPFAFEHEATREGCVVCHDPHGSVNNKLLKARNADLCLKCHLAAQTANITIGGLPHQFFMSRGTCWTAGCHEAVHGSHVSSSLRF